MSTYLNLQKPAPYIPLCVLLPVPVTYRCDATPVDLVNRQLTLTPGV